MGELTDKRCPICNSLMEREQEFIRIDKNLATTKEWLVCECGYREEE